ncbi:MAG: hypothetical protein LBS49_12530, partial [Candidatus Accumulibacter sp.]|nr:hypothetical protein [Accumulibacter sp.]
MDTVVALDANALITLFSNKGEVGKKARIHFLIDETRKSRGRLIIPAPALSEFSVRAKPEEIRLLLEERIFRVAPFDTRAALECGTIYKTWLSGQSKPELKIKIKFDRKTNSGLKPRPSGRWEPNPGLKAGVSATVLGGDANPF